MGKIEGLWMDEEQKSAILITQKEIGRARPSESADQGAHYDPAVARSRGAVPRKRRRLANAR